MKIAGTSTKPKRPAIPTSARTTNPIIEPVTGLIYPSNGAASSAIRIVFTGANLPSRTLKTVLWEAKYVQHTGYYAWAWDSWGDNAWHSGTYESGCHPFPCDGAFNGSGAATGATGGSGTVHYYEIAGAGDAADWIATPSGSSYSVTKGVWVRQGFTDEVVNVSGTNYIRRSFYVDLSDTSKVIVRDQVQSALGSPSSPIFALGSSEWRDDIGGSGITDEASSGTFRKILINSAKLSTANMVSVLACESNSAVLALGLSNMHYLNMNPTPSDVTDKSGAGHNPSWANGNRPTLYTG